MDLADDLAVAVAQGLDGAGPPWGDDAAESVGRDPAVGAETDLAQVVARLVGLDPVMGPGQWGVVVIARLERWTTVVGTEIRRRVVVVQAAVAEVRRVREHVAEHPQEGSMLDRSGVLVTVDRVHHVEVDHRLQGHVAVLEKLGKLLQEHRADSLHPSDSVGGPAEDELGEVDIDGRGTTLRLGQRRGVLVRGCAGPVQERGSGSGMG